MASCSNLSINKGEGKVFVDSIVTVAGAPQDITGWGLAFYLFAPEDPGTQFLIKDNGTNSGVTILVPSTAGQLQIAFAPADTNDLAIGAYSFSVWRTDSGVPLKLTYGFMTVGSPA